MTNKRGRSDETGDVFYFIGLGNGDSYYFSLVAIAQEGVCFMKLEIGKPFLYEIY
jgi:hypothetical protein